VLLITGNGYVGVDKGEEDMNSIKLLLKKDSDIADVLAAAARCGQFQFLHNQKKHYDIMYQQ